MIYLSLTVRGLGRGGRTAVYASHNFRQGTKSVSLGLALSGSVRVSGSLGTHLEKECGRALPAGQAPWPAHHLGEGGGQPPASGRRCCFVLSSSRGGLAGWQGFTPAGLS